MVAGRLVPHLMIVYLSHSAGNLRRMLGGTRGPVRKRTIKHVSDLLAPLSPLSAGDILRSHFVPKRQQIANEN